MEIIHESTKDAFNDVVFYGDEGTLYVDRSGITANPKSAVDSPFGGKDWRLPDIGRSHRRNWIDCIRSRKRPVADVSYGAHTSILCSLANHGYQLRRDLQWDARNTVPRRSRCQRPHRPPRPRRVEIGLMKLT